MLVCVCVCVLHACVVARVCVQHAVVPLGGHQEVSAAGGAVGEGAAGVHHRGGGGQADHTHVAQEVP